MVRSSGGAAGVRPVRWLDTFNEKPPTTTEYLRAISETWPTLPVSEATNVRAAFRAQIARGGKITATDMAIDLDLSAPIVANRIYGIFGHRIANQLGVKRRGDDEWWFVMSMGGGHDSTGRWIWSLRPALWRALHRFKRDTFAPFSLNPDPGTDETIAKAEPARPPDEGDWRERVERLVMERPGQGHFRAALLLAYGGRCAVTGSAVREALEASHIVPFRYEPNDAPENGLLLRADLHLLFDAGLMTVSANTRRVTLDPTLRKTGSGYEKLHDKPLRHVQRGHKPPSGEALRRRAELQAQVQKVVH
jgi:hypothetical protein